MNFILGGDIGGTNCNLGVFGIKNSQQHLLASFHFKSKELKNVYEPINSVLRHFKENHNIRATKASIGAAGAVSYQRDYVHLTNAKLDIDKKELISKYRKSDKIAKETFQIFGDAYARFAKGCALDALAYGGVYIAGGIAQKNPDIFGKKFVSVFQESHKMRHILRKIPIYLITNPDAGLIGAGFAGAELLK